MEIIPIEIQGIKCFLDNIGLKSHFESKTQKYTKKYYGKNKGKMEWQTVYEKLYKSVPRKGFYVGSGAIDWLNKHSEDINFEIAKVYPPRVELDFNSLYVPEGMKSSPKFKVNGKERFYFYEALSQCFKNPTGTIKLPTGSGKTEIQLVLAENQRRQIGTGMILVPTITIKDQFIQRAQKYGIPLIDYHDFNTLSSNNSLFITTHHILCERLKDKSKKEAVLSELNRVDFTIVDECAHSTCASWFNILLNLNNCQRCHGFSALPVAYETEVGTSFHELDSDDARTIGILGSVIYEKSSEDLKEFLNLPELINLRYSWPENHHPDQMSKDWHKIRKAIRENKERTRFISDVFNFLIKNNYKTCTFVKEREHAKQILKYCGNPEIACWFGGGEAFTLDEFFTPGELKEKFGKSLKGLILTSHGIEGLDFDDPLNVLLLHEGKSVRQTIQMAGRIARPDEGSASIIINICDRGCTILPKHGNIRAGDIINEFKSRPRNCGSFSSLLEELQVIQESLEDDSLE